MIKCNFCNKLFSTRAAFSNHLTRTEKSHFKNDLEKERFLVYSIFGEQYVEDLIIKYKNEEICCYDLDKSNDISKYITLLGIKRTNSQEKQTIRYKEKYRKSIQLKYGNDITNISQVIEVQKKKEETIASHFDSYNSYLKQHRIYMKQGYTEYIGDHARLAETTSKIKKTCLAKYGHENFGCGIDAKKKRKETFVNTIANWEYEERLERTSKARAAVNHRGGFSSKPEKRIRHCLTELNIDFKSNIQLWHYNYDIVFDNIIIEIQGDMWHANPEKYKANDLIMGKISAKSLWEKDAKKRKKAEEHGYRLIEIWECAIVTRNDAELIEYVKGLIC